MPGTARDVMAHATRHVPVFGESDTVAAVHQALASRHYDAVSHVVVCRAGRFAGLVALEDVLPAAADTRLLDLLDAKVPVVSPGSDRHTAVLQAVLHHQSVLAVVDADGQFAGLVPARQLLSILSHEHERGQARRVGFLHDAAGIRRSSREGLYQRLVHRLPWLLLGLLVALSTADLIAWFETRLGETALLLFFVPGIVYLADAVGTQTEMVVVRGLAVGVPVRRIFLREWLTGVVIGLLLAVLTGLLVAWRWDNATLALALGLAVWGTCAIASAVAMSLPWLLDRAGVDPAYGSGPLATVIQDLLSLLIYFLIVIAVYV